MPDPLHWFRRSAQPPPPDADDEPGTLLGVPEAPPWLDDPDWHEAEPDESTAPEERE